MTRAGPVLQPKEIVTDGSVCPDLVTVEEFGHHKSRVRADGTRIWTFEQPWGATKFQKIGHLARFKRLTKRG